MSSAAGPPYPLGAGTIFLSLGEKVLPLDWRLVDGLLVSYGFAMKAFESYFFVMDISSLWHSLYLYVVIDVYI